MRRVKKRARKSKRSHFRLDAWANGMIWALSALAGREQKDIRDDVDKTDGQRPSLKAIDRTLAKKRKNPMWRRADEKSCRPGSDKEAEVSIETIGVSGTWQTSCYSQVVQDGNTFLTHCQQTSCVQGATRRWLEMAGKTDEDDWDWNSYCDAPLGVYFPTASIRSLRPDSGRSIDTQWTHNGHFNGHPMDTVKHRGLAPRDK